MNNSIETKKFLIKEFEKLDKEGQNKLLEYAKRLTRSRGDKNSNVLKLAGSISTNEIKLIDEVIKEGCEKVDHDEW